MISTQFVPQLCAAYSLVSICMDVIISTTASLLSVPSRLPCPFLTEIRLLPIAQALTRPDACSSILRPPCTDTYVIVHTFFLHFRAYSHFVQLAHQSSHSSSSPCVLLSLHRAPSLSPSMHSSSAPLMRTAVLVATRSKEPASSQQPRPN